MTASFTNRYQATLKGNLIQIGNTLGLSKASNVLTPGTLGSIGAFITTDSSLQATGWPVNTTLDYTKNSSPATLTLPSGATVVRAELIWSASYVVPGSDITAQITNAITFTDPQGTAHSITATGVSNTGISLTENSESSTSYVKSADVTNIVVSGGSGTYICGSVPATMSSTANNLQYAGWSLYVVYSKSSDPVRNIVIFVGQTTAIDAPYSVPANYPGTPFPIRLFYSAAEGDANVTGDQLNTTAVTGMSAMNLSTSAQPSNNPFSSQITDQNGNLLTVGIFGTTNHNASTGTNVSGARQGWDIANNISITSAFSGGAVTNVGLDIGTNNDPAILTSNAFVVDLSQPIATLTKSASKTYAFAGETIDYTLVYKFTTVPMTTSNIVVIDTVPNGATFQTGSVIVDNVTNGSASPNPPGISLGTITGVTTFTITYKVVANSTVDPVKISNDAFGSYNFTTGGTTFKNENISNSATTTIDPFSATITQSSNKKYLDINDTLSYTITIPNSGSTLNYAIFIDTIPSGTSLVDNSFKVNDVIITNANIKAPAGVTIPSIAINSMNTINFDVTVTTVPSTNLVSNIANLSVKYTLDPSTPNGILKIMTANTVNTTINFAQLQLAKTVDKSYADIGDTLTYTALLKNIGNVSASNIIFSEQIPQGVAFVSNSVTLNGVTQSGGDPRNGVSISSISSGQTATIVFKVSVIDIPINNKVTATASATGVYTTDPSIPNGKSINLNSNTVETTINSAILSVNNTVDKVYSKPGEQLTYTVVLKNLKNTTMNNVVFKDTIPASMSFVSNSFKVNGETKIGSNPVVGVSLDTIPIGTTTISFKAEIISVPNATQIVNQSFVNYSYTVNPSIPNGVTKSKETNSVITQINYAEFRTITTSVNKASFKIGEEITYTVVAANTGSKVAKDVLIKNNLSEDLTFIADSITVNGVSVPGGNIMEGINVGDVAVGGVTTVTYKTIII